MRTTESNKWVCRDCDKPFVNKFTLTRHREAYCKGGKDDPHQERQTDHMLPHKPRFRKKDPQSTHGPLVPPGTWAGMRTGIRTLMLTNDGGLTEGLTEGSSQDSRKGSTEGSTEGLTEGSTSSELSANDALAQMIQTTIKAQLDARLGTMVSYNEGKGEKGRGEGTGKGEDKDEGKGSEADKEDGKEPKIDIVCLAKGDYIKKIIQLHDGDEEKAMNYIKNVGIATDFLEGDFRLIKKIYFDGKKKSQFPIRIKDFKRNKLEYLEENGEWILDIRGEIVGKRLCENIVSTLLIANTQFNEVIIAEKDEDRKELLLDLFQINKTQAHIMKLLERKTQGKLSKRVAEFINFCTEVHAETGSLENVKKAYE